MNANNPMGTDGFEFLEFCSPDPEKLSKQFEQFGFKAIAKHREKDVTLFRQGISNFILNAENNSQAAEFSQHHGPAACAMAFRVEDANHALEHARKHGAELFPNKLPAIKGIGGSVIFFVDRYQPDDNIYLDDFDFFEPATNTSGLGLTYIDHVTHNVYRGNMDKWAKFYEDIFNFREIRYFDIQGLKTGLISRAMTSPCGKIRIPINESTDPKSQIEEYLNEFKGEGIQHIALGSDDIYQSGSR